MINIIDKASCSGCTACYSKCPKNCISMVEDEEGFLYPKVNSGICVNCGLCEKVCPVINKKIESSFEQEAYLVQHRDDKVRKDSSAGGAFTGIASWVLDQGGVVFGAAYDEDFVVHHTYVENISDLYKFRNSKYVQSVVGDSFRQVKYFLEKDRWVCFSGTPCQIEGLNAYLNNKYEKLVLVDVVCHGIPSPLIWRKYLEYLKSKGLSFDNIRFRDKYYGYKYSTMSVIDEGKVIYHAGSQLDPMLRAFFSDACDRPICYECPFKKRYRVSDYTIWDCFTVNKFDKKLDDDKGTTRVLCHSELGKKILEESSLRMTYIKVEADKLVENVKEMYESVEKAANRDAFMADAKILKGSELFSKYYPISIQVKMKTAIRKVLLLTGVYGFAKKVVNFIKGR